MNEPSPDKPSSVRPPEDRLDSWKEIAAYLNRDVTTVQRWEKREGMPVHRHQHDRIGSVYAFRADLDAWARSRRHKGANLEASGEIDAGKPTVESPSELHRSAVGRNWKLWLALAGVVACSFFGFWWLQQNEYFWRSPIENARFQPVTDFEGAEQAAAISRDGQ